MDSENGIMKYQFKRVRSDFWINIYKKDDAYSISTNDKYIKIINHFFPMLEAKSPTKWRKSENYSNVSSLWLPNRCYEQNTINMFLNWCKEAIQDILWLGLNKNIEEYFYNELDYCIASDFNFVYNEGRTEIGEAEYQLKYNVENLSKKEQEKYSDIIINKILCSCKYIPVENRLDWYVSSMPATESGKAKLAWKLAEEVSEQLRIPFINPTLKCDKPQMKQLSIKEKIETWEEIYYNGDVILDRMVRGKNILVIDDLYQSGITMWKYAGFLKEMGAKSVFGVVCVKSLKDSDNT